VNHNFDTLYDASHNLNIYLHIGFGSIAIILGLIQLVNLKGGSLHKRIGRLFLICFGVVIFAATLGIFLFEFRLFLTALTLSAAYTCISGYRVTCLKGLQPGSFDNIVTIVCLFACAAFIFTLEVSYSNYSTVTIYATIGGLILMCLYDCVRNFMSSTWLQAIWLDEHIFKMISALGALLSAASGNVLSELGAVAQLSPVALTFSISVCFIVLRKRMPLKAYQPVSLPRT